MCDPVCRNLKQPADGEITMMAADGYHPGPAIYARWAELAAGLILAE